MTAHNAAGVPSKEAIAMTGRGAVDTHVHVWKQTDPWMHWLDDRPAGWAPVRNDFSWARLRSELDAADVADLVLVQAGTSTAETRLLLELAGAQPSVIGVVGWVSLSSAAATERGLTTLTDAGDKLVGIRALHRWQPDGEILAGREMIDAVRLLAERDLTLDLFVNDHTELPLLLALIDAVPHGRYIVDHLGRPPIDRDSTARHLWELAMSRLAQRPNVYVKYSGWATNVGRVVAKDVVPFGDHVLSTFGPTRTMWASNWPVALVGGDYQDTLRATLDALSALSSDELNDVVGRTARRCYLPKATDATPA